MDVDVAQREMRRVYRGGSVGQWVSGALWIGSAAVAAGAGRRPAILLLVVGGFFIFPVTSLLLRLLGGPWRASRENPLNSLAMQVAFVLPLCLPLVAGATLYRPEWFYPAFMVLVGAHYLPFVFLYGMRHFGALAFLLVGLGIWFARRPVKSFEGPGWAAGILLVIFGTLSWILARREREPETVGA